MPNIILKEQIYNELIDYLIGLVLRMVTSYHLKYYPKMT